MRFPLERFKIVGHSMEPDFYSGQRIIINRWAYIFSDPTIGDIIAFRDRHDKGKIALKKVKKILDKSYYVVGLNQEDSQDSRSFGYISSKEIIGKFFTRY
ncbi:MAG: S26 family signal peptidase [Candidatus Woykebacteria bacterium]